MAQFIYVHCPYGRVALNVDHIVSFAKVASGDKELKTCIETIEDTIYVKETFEEVQALCQRL